LRYPDFVDGKRMSASPGRINTQSIADSTGIPRETVRRKLQLLIDRGWIERTPDGGLVITQRVTLAMASATQATFDYLLDVTRAITDCIDGEEGPAR
jgi:DNA-binding IclR family transcriptional regulator